MTFSEFTGGPEGTFEAAEIGDRIQDAFYGPVRAGAAAIFERSNIGAFGATRQQCR